MDEFCGSPFWDEKTIWDTDDPDFTICFEKTVLVWIPCVFLWIFLPLEVYFLRRSSAFDIPWNFYNVSKLIVIFILATLALTDIANYVFNDYSYLPVNFYSPLIRFTTCVLFFGVTYANIKCGIRSSAVLFVFSLLLLICGTPQYRTEFRLRCGTDNARDTIEFATYMLYYPALVMIFVLNCFADSRPRILRHPLDENACPENGSSVLSQLLFAWFDPLTWKGYKKPLENEDLWSINYTLSSASVVRKFEKHWNEIVERAKKTSNVRIKGVSENGALLRNGGESVNTSENAELIRNAVDGVENDGNTTQVSILPALYRTFGTTFIIGTTLKVFLDMLPFVSPQILSLLIDFIDGNEQMWKGYVYAVALFFVAFLQSLLTAQYLHRMYMVGLQIRTSLISVIYKKALRISNGARKDFTMGETVNLMSVDAERFVDLMAYMYLLFSTPVQIVLALYFLWQILGASIFAGFGVIIVSILVNWFVADRLKTLQLAQMKNKDNRVKLMNEILSGFKVLKLYAWESSFEKHVLSVRNEETRISKQQAYWDGFMSFMWAFTAFMFPLVTFAVFVLSDEKHIFDAKVAFVSLSLFNALKLPLLIFPIMVTFSVQGSASLKRINKFLNSEDLSFGDVTHENRAEALVIENASFAWEGQNGSPILHNINLKVDSGALVAVVGPVGAGKSSLISAFLGEMYKLSGIVNTRGTIAYVPQQAWIQNATLRDNITLGENINEVFYDRILEACALKPDLEILPGGDLTEIGEKGINLSGGQKQRISLARAVYFGAEVYFLDDPLSAVDSHVGKHIFDRVIGPSGLLKDKTRVLVTHSVTYLSQVDFIVVIKDGSVSESGTFEELLDNKGDFSEFLESYLREVDEPDEEELNKLKAILGEEKVASERLVRQKSKISESESGGPLNRQKSTTHERKGKDDDVIGDKLIEVEHVETGNVKWQVYVYYLRSVGFFLSFFIIFMNFLIHTLSLASNVWLSEWSSDSNATNPDGTQVADKRDLYLSVYAMLGISQGTVEFIADITIRLACWKSARLLHNLMLKNVFRLPLSFMDVTPAGRILSRFSKDIDVLDNKLPDEISNFIYSLGDVLFTLIIISYTTPTFAFFVFPISVVYYIVQRFYVTTSRQLKRLESISRSPIYSHFVETVSGAQSVRAYGLSEKFIKQSEEKVDFNMRSYYLNLVSNRWLAVRTETIGNVIIFFAALFAVLERDTLSAGMVGLSVSYALQITQTLNWFVFITSEAETNIVSVERVKEYSETSQEAAWKIPNEPVPQNWPSKGDIAFQDFQVRYRNGLDLVLKGISFFINGGEKVGIVGRTGAGKSSLTLSLFRIIESAGGKILIDGVDIAALGLYTLRSKLTIIPQDPVLFCGSLRMNLDPGEEYSDEKIWHALELAHLKSHISSSDVGLQFEVTEGGENFSVGQRQLICLARALLRKTKVLILDEATAAIDLETDDLIQSTIRSEFADCTVLTIAHRLNTIMDYDKIIVLDKGYLVEYDSPKVLLESKSSVFYGMAVDAGLV
ncbi:multidrug resistance-associated protein 1-like [Planococcus citri]|uniref:multidrug resistance-associated protein 1-like n=1 Tax=Planococcus citri TaxID=170843 RepID=UPI0031F78D54